MKDKLFIIIIIVMLGGLFLFTSFLSNKEVKITVNEELLGIDYEVDGNLATLNYETDNPVVAMYIEGYGSVVIELYPDIAPNTVNNFISLVKSGFYDKNTFHRLIPGFVLQGGDPTGTGNGGPEYTIRGEFKENGFDNELKHEKWIVSMARSKEFDSAGSQFFICLDKASHLDNNYAAFGKVIDGFKTLEKIAENEEVDNKEIGTLKKNLVLKKALIDLKGKDYSDPEIIK